MSEGRFKSYDYGVLGLFVLVLIGVSLSWYNVSITFENQSLGAGASGWHFTWGVLAFVAALIALLVVGLKALVAPGSLLPGWYKEGPLVMGLGDLVALFAIIGLIDKPGRGVDLMGMMTIGYGVGIFLTLIAGLLMGVCGILARRDRSAGASGAPRAGITVPDGAWRAGPLQAGPWQTEGWPGEASAGQASGGETAAAESSQSCQACGTQLEPGSRFCRSCGRPQDSPAGSLGGGGR